MERKHLVIPFQIKQLQEDEEFYHIEGYGSTYDVDLGKERIEPGAFTESLKKRMPKFVYQHDIRKPIGVWDTAVEDGKGLYLKGRMPKKNRHVQDAVPLIKMGAFGGLSIGYCIEDFEVKDDIYILKTVTLWEVSLVTLPMNPDATIESIKAVVPFKDLPLGDRTDEWDSGAAVKRVKEFTGSTEAPSSSYKNGFLWYDAENTDLFGSYKLPIADIKDGKLVAMPRAIFAAAAVMQGARGGVDIPEADKMKVKGHLGKYYAKMKKEFDDEGIVAPWEKSFSVDDVKEFTKRDFEKSLRESGIFSNEASKYLASRFEAPQREVDGVIVSEEVLNGVKEIINILKGDK